MITRDGPALASISGWRVAGNLQHRKNNTVTDQNNKTNILNRQANIYLDLVSKE